MLATKNLARFASLGTALCTFAGMGLSPSAEGTAVGYVVTSTNVSTGGQNLVVYTLWARFDGPTDTLLNGYNLAGICGSSLVGFWHKDNAYYNSGVLSQEFGTWNPSQTGSATLNRPFDSYLTIGNQATATNTTNADPSWVSGGNADLRSWNRPDIPNNGTIGWFNSNPPNIQGRVGQNGNTATDVRLGQFVLSASDTAPRAFQLTIAYNNGIAGSSVQFYTGAFVLGNQGLPPTWYRDLDGDGFGAAASGTQIACTQPAGFVGNNLDCNDALITYADNDGDTFGAGPIAACGVGNNTDCDDANAAINPNTVWVRDVDGDGFGYPADGTVVQCAQPAGYALNGSDNCPTIANAGQQDCDANGIGDVCDLAAGVIGDCDGDGVPDSCEGATLVDLRSPLLAPFGADASVTYTFSGLAAPNGVQPRLVIDAVSDLNTVQEYIGVVFDGSAPELFFVADGSDCPTTPDRATRVFSTGEFANLTADGQLTVVVTASGLVSSTQCAGGGIRLRLVYTTLGTGSDCNGNAQLDSCEIASGGAFDCNANGVIDDCENPQIVRSWGDATSGQTSTPSDVGIPSGLAAGASFTIARRADGTVRAWGDNTWGQLNIPAGLTGVRAVDAGADHSLAIRGDGTVVAWGRNNLGQCNVPADLGSVRAVAGGWYHNVAITGSGGVRCWGDNALGQATPPAALSAVSVAAGGFHSMAIRPDGTVACWGYNAQFQCNVPAGLNSVRAIAAGIRHSVALRQNGTVACWGSGSPGQTTEYDFGQSTVPADLGAVIAIDAGLYHTVALRADGFVRCWGDNSTGVCSVPSEVSRISRLTSGWRHVVAVGSDDDCNRNGRPDLCDLNAGTSTDLDGNGVLDECAGEFVVGGSGYTNIQAAIDAAPAGAIVKVAAGTWTGGLQISARPVTVQSLAGSATTILSGSGLTRSIVSVRGAATNGTVLNGFRLENGATGTAEFGVRIGGALFLDNTTSTVRNCVFRSNASEYGGAIYALNYSGQIEDCTFENNSASVDGGAVQLGFGGTWTVARSTFTGNSAGRNAGAVHVVHGIGGNPTTGSIVDCVMRSNSASYEGSAISWFAATGPSLVIDGCTIESNTGGNAACALEAASSTPTAFTITDSRFCLNSPANLVGTVTGGTGNTFSQDCNSNGICDADEISSGSATDCDGDGFPDSCQLGAAFAWGENANGQTVVPDAARRAVSIAAGCNHGLALGGNGTVTAWGSDTFGQRTVPSSVVQARLIAAGCDHSLAVLADGTVRGWGYNAFNQCTIPVAANGNVVQVAAGANHSGVRKSNGTLVLWGRNIDGECNVPGTLGAVSGFALGGAHSVGLRADGTIVCWGLNNFGQTTVPASVGTLQAVAAGCYHTVGLRTNGTVAAWGSTLFGQTTVPAGLTNVVAIAAGSGQHTLALRADGSVVSWGWNAFGQTNVPSTASSIDEIAAGGTFSLARRGSAVDCNSNGAIDSCEIAAGTVPDCNANGVPDACDVFGGVGDCNGNGIPDSCELASGAAFDCDGNGRIDTCDVAMGMGSDCNGNGKLDTCDLAAGTSTDLNGNGVLDECAGEYVVGGSGFRSVQAAIDAAPAGTTIRVGPGTYTGGITITSKPVSLQSIAGAATTTLSGSGLDRSTLIIRTSAANGSVVDGFTFTGGAIGTAEFGTRLGGAMLLIETQAEVRNCRFIGNQSTYGGAIYAYRFTGTVEQSTFEMNQAIDDAGAIQFGFGGAFIFRNNNLQDNSAGRHGGALHVVHAVDGPLTTGSITDCTFGGNSAGVDGSAIAWTASSGSNLPITGCTIENNAGPAAACSKLATSTSPSLAFAVLNSRFCVNAGGNISGPVQDLGGNIFSQDCNQNGICDIDEISGGNVTDCDSNGIPDGCQIADGSATDCDADGFPDSCQLGAVAAWGENNSGQSTVPANLGASRDIAAGCNHALAIRTDGTLAVWGSNSFGQRTVPSGLTTASQIAAGCDHSLALSKGGVLYAWGYNAFNQCVIPSAANGNIAQIAAGANHSGVRKNDGSLVLWGRNIDGECNVPGTLGPVASFALGGAHSVGLRADGTVACWGLNNFGQCNVPASAGTLREVAAGCYHTVGLRTDGTVVAWGSTLFGQTTVPAGLNGVVAIAAGSGQHTLALRSDGTVVAWGWNAFGQSTVPGGLAGVEQISAGGTFSLVRTAGSDDCNNNGQIDSCELAANPALDCNGNGVPDSCDLADGAPDCNGNGRPDACDLASGSPDCNGNGVPDSCDIFSGVSTDLNANLVPDECAGEWIVGGSGFRTIQAAVTAAPSGTTIRVGPGTYTGSVLVDSKPIQLVSLAGAENTILSGSGATSSILAFRSSAANGFLLDGFTLRDGPIGTAAFQVRVGGALFLDNVSGTVRNCRFLNNTSEFGGAVYSIGFSGSIEQCLFDGNSASVDAGALQIGFGGTSVVRKNVFRNNTANAGGAMHVIQWDSGPVTTTAISDCQFFGNRAEIQGAALLWYAATGSNLDVAGCTVESNIAPDAAFTRYAGNLAFDFLNTRFCLNQPTNVNDATAINDLGGNTFSQDCNRNGICDADEIASGSESDCNANGIPDSCELTGTLLAFGDGGLGQLAIPSDLGRPLAIATGCDHSLALRTDGTVRAWGQNTFGQATVPADLPSVQAITAGCDHTLALTTSGGVRAWGYNAFGQCNVPAISGTIVEIAAGANHSGVRRSDGSLVLWGRNVDGECNVPAGLGPVVQLALGGAHSVGRRADGTIVCWGLNNFGQCNVPANVGTLQSVAAGCYHTVGLRTNGTVVAWGSSLFGQTSVPGGLNNVVAIAAGSGQHTLALKSNGTVVAWGWNAFGQSTVPAAAVDVIKIAAGGTHSMVLTRPASDCNGNNQIDSCEIANGTQSDCNANGVLDSCELASGLAADCNKNGVLDSCDIANGTPDCNGNGRPDTCDLALGSSTDLNGNTVPDECAGEFVVGGSGYATIQAAIDAAPDGATIGIAPGSWPPFTVQGRRLTIASFAGAETTFVDGGGTQRAASLSNIAPLGVLIDGLTFRNGSAPDGAGMKLLLASPKIANCVFEDNVTTGPGGGVCCFSSSPLFEDCVIRNNAALRGGGVWVTGIAQDGGFAQFDQCVISFNDAAADGAGIGNEGRVLLTGCFIESNIAGVVGGGLRTLGAAATSAVGSSFFCLNVPDNTSGVFTDLTGNILGDDCNSNGVCDIDEIAAGAEDKNQNGKLDTCELARGDLNLDEVINAADLSVLLNFWGASNPPAGDLNGDGIITAADLAIMLNNWGGT